MTKEGTLQRPSDDLAPYTYTGLLDDAMLRYSREFEGQDFFRKMLAKNVFFGGGMFINDGYLVNHPVARRQLADHKSLLRVMLDESFVRVLTRAGSPESLAQMPVKMAESGNRSFQQLINSSEWDEFGPVFKEVAVELFRREKQRNWPKIDMSYGYVKLMNQYFVGRTAAELGVSSLNTDDMRFISDAFLEMEPEKGNARDKFEKAATQYLQTRNRFSHESMREVMEVANQCYHYNFGLAMNWDLEKERSSAGVAVDTTNSKTFADLHAVRSISWEQFDNIPLLPIPEDIPFHDGLVFRELLIGSTPIGMAKERYLLQLKTLLSDKVGKKGGPALLAAKKEMAEATEEYARRLSEHLGISMNRIRPDQDSLTMVAGSTGHPEEDWSETDAQFVVAIRMQEQEKASTRTRDILLKRFRLLDPPNGRSRRRDQSRVITLKDIRLQIASLEFDHSRARDFLKDVPVFT